MIFSNLVSRIPTPTLKPNAQKCLILAHREELIQQAYNHLWKHNQDKRIALEQSTKRAIVDDADIIVASVPTLGRKGSSRLLKYDPSKFKAIIVDEAHHAVSDSYKRIFSHFGLMSDAAVRNDHTLLWGCSATLLRHDERHLAEVFDEIIYHLDLKDMIAQSYLSEFKVHTVKTQISFVDKVKLKNGDYDAETLNKAVNTLERNLMVVKIYKDMVEKDDLKSTLVFAVNVDHVQKLVHAFREQDIAAIGITSDTARAKRFQAIRDFREGKVPVLVNCGILCEGTDIPNIDSLIMARPTLSPILYQQMLGRGSRLSPGKDKCHVIDFVDNCLTHPPMNVPTLFRECSNEEDSGKNISVKLNKKKPLQKPAYIEVFQDLVEWQLFSEKDWLGVLADFKHKSRLSWLIHSCNNTQLKEAGLDLGKDGYFYYKENEENFYLINFDWKNNISSSVAFDIGPGASFNAVMKYMDSLVLSRFRGAKKLVLKSLPWKRELSTEKQILYLNSLISSFGKPLALDEGAKLTKGDVADMITCAKLMIIRNQAHKLSVV